MQHGGDGLCVVIMCTNVRACVRARVCVCARARAIEGGMRGGTTGVGGRAGACRQGAQAASLGLCC